MREERFEKLRARLDEMNSRNARLEDEIRVLRGQYEEAMKLAGDVERTHEENARMQKATNELKAERDEVQQRLNIALQKIEEVRREVTPGVAKTAVPHERLAEARDELARERERARAEVAELRERLEEARRDADKAKDAKLEAERAICRVLEAAQARFGSVFASAEQLREFLATPEEKRGEAEGAKLQSLKKESARIVGKLQKKLKAEKKGRKRAIAKVKEDQMGYQKQRVQLEQAVCDLEDQVEEAHKAVRVSDMHHREELNANDARIRELEGAVEYLRSQNAQLKSASMMAVETRVEKPVVVNDGWKERAEELEREIREKEHAIAVLKKQNSSELKSRQRENERIQGQVKGCEAKIAEMTEELRKVASDKEKLEIECAELKESLENALAQQQADKVAFQRGQTELSDVEGKASALKQANGILQQTIERQKNELSTMYGEREKLVALVQSVVKVMGSVESALEKANSENKRLNGQIQDMRAMDVKEPVHETVVEQVPYTSWFTPEFPSDLRNLLSDLAQNNVWPVSVKLKHILAAIAKYYNGLVAEKEKLADEKQRNLDVFHDKLDSFLVSLGTVVEHSTLNSEQLLSDGRTAGFIIEAISVMKAKSQEATKLSERINSQIAEICKAMGVSNVSDCVPEIQKRCHERKRMAKLTKGQKEKIKKLKGREKRMLCTLQEQEFSLKKVIDGQKATIADLENRNREAQAKILEHRTAISDLRVKADSLRDITKSDLDQGTSVDMMHQLQQTHEHEKQRLSGELEAAQRQLSEYSSRLQKLERENYEWKNKAVSMKKEKKHKESEIQELAAQIHNLSADYQQRITAEKQSLKDHYEQLIEKLKEKNNELRQMSAKSGEAAEACESKNRELMKRLCSFDKENEAMKQKYQLKDEEIGRERQLLDTKSRALAIQTEMKCQTLIEEIKLKHQEEKTQICSYVISQFKELFDGRQYLDVACMKHIVEKASHEYHKLLASDQAIRRLLCISVPEATEDAVARLLLSAYSH